MSEYVCPQYIQDMFIGDEDQKSKARKLVVDWYKSLDAKIGDRIYLPELGWYEKAERVN